MTTDRDDSNPAFLNRRAMLGVTAVGLTWTWSGLAIAGPRAGAAKPTRPTAKPTSEPARPKAAPVDDPPKRRRRAAAANTPKFQKLTSPLSAEEKALGDAIADRVKHAIVAAAAAPTRSRFHKGGYASLAQGYVKTLPAKRRTATAGKANALLAAPIRERKIRLGSAASLAKDAHRRALKPLPKTIAQAAETRIRAKLRAMPAPPRILTKLPNPYTKLGIHLNSIKCVEETDEVGADEIVLGAILVSPNGDVQRTQPITISNDFDAGETRTYYKASSSKFDAKDPKKGKHIISVPLAGSDFPAPYTVLLALWERDDGGFSDMMHELYVVVAREAKLELMSAGNAAAGPVGAFIALLTSYVLEAVLAFLSWLFENPDDRIDEHQATMTLNSFDETYFAAFPGEAATPANVWAAGRYTVKFKGDGGYYRARLHWRVWR